ncbi:MAG: hypothetical protein ACFFDH_14000 [Promethearchaeota archaeon]
MSDSSKTELANKIKAEYNKKLKDLEAKIVKLHTELIKIQRVFTHETKRVDHLNLSNLSSKKAELNANIAQLKKEIKKVNKEKIKRLRKL